MVAEPNLYCNASRRAAQARRVTSRSLSNCGPMAPAYLLSALRGNKNWTCTPLDIRHGKLTVECECQAESERMADSEEGERS